MVSTIETKTDWPEVCSIPKLVELMGGAISEASLYSAAREGRLAGCRRLGHRQLIHVPTFLTWLQTGSGDERET